MIEQLQIIKPKRIKESLSAILSPNFITLDFGITKVVIPCSTGFSPSIINHKDLYSFEYDTAISLNTIMYKKEPSFDYKWEDCIITAADTAIFSSFSGSGDDEYYFGTLEIDSALSVICYGFTYMAHWKTSKIRNGSKLFYNVDYQVFYYLFQMFKSLSGKKIDKLLWTISGDDLVLTNENHSFYIICTKDDKQYKYKARHLPAINTFFQQETKNEKQLLKKDLADLFGSVAKHLIRSFDDVVSVSENNIFTRLKNGEYSVCLTKMKS